MERAFRKYGVDNFNFEILELCNPEELNEKENYWIKECQSSTKDNGYNVIIDNKINPAAIQERKTRFREKYSVDNPSQLDWVKEKVKIARLKNGYVKCLENLETGLVFTSTEAKEWIDIRMKNWNAAISNYFHMNRHSCGKIPEADNIDPNLWHQKATWKIISYDEYLKKKNEQINDNNNKEETFNNG